jgi:hypothetical protein
MTELGLSLHHAGRANQPDLTTYPHRAKSCHDGYVHYGNVHENKPSSPLDGHFKRFLTAHGGAGRSHLNCPCTAGERARRGRRGADKLKEQTRTSSIVWRR